MEQDRDSILQLLIASLDDIIFSRREKREVKQALAEIDLSKHDKDWLRSQVFDLAREKISSNNNYQILSWLEEANKVLLSDKTNDTSENRVYFSPGVDCLNAIIYQVKNAIQSLDICVFTITDDRISRELIAAEKRGVHIRIITDGNKAEDLGSDIDHLDDNGIEIREDYSPEHMHHKFAVIDDKTLITGSYNWTRSAAEKNEENIIISNEPDLVKPFIREFEKLWHQLKGGYI